MRSSNVAVIIPNWNGAHLLPTCLDALRRQTYRDFEVVVVDNGSTDDSRQLIQDVYQEVRLLPLPSNLLFAGGVNAGIRATDSPVVVALNNDTEVEPGWLAALTAALEHDPAVGMAASKLLLFDRRTVLHSAGDFYRVNGIPGNRGVWEEDRGQYDIAVDVFSACGGAAAYRRSMLEEIGLFDEDLGAYCEDIDLALRGHLAGYRCLFAPGARVYHRLSATGGGPFASYYCGRNFISVAVKNLPASLLRKYWWGMLGSQLGYIWESLRHFREPAARARLRGQLVALLELPRTIAKRRQVSSLKKVTDGYLESLLTP